MDRNPRVMIMTLMVLTHLILNGMVKSKVRFGEEKKVAKKNNQVENVVEKLCLQLKGAQTDRQWRDTAYCLSLLSYTSEKSVKVDKLPARNAGMKQTIAGFSENLEYLHEECNGGPSKDQEKTQALYKRAKRKCSSEQLRAQTRILRTRKTYSTTRKTTRIKAGCTAVVEYPEDEENESPRFRKSTRVAKSAGTKAPSTRNAEKGTGKARKEVGSRQRVAMDSGAEDPISD
ncbi:hypothetical protein BJ742DRAFT_898880 [Cladochytrium replicatum]|nr:hypothetical protein BJ742DRAFT_898880 [Cladochytrium replicatum]